MSLLQCLRENKKHKAILALLYSCGLRVSEVINLKWSHIDRSRMVINIIGGKGNVDRQIGLPNHIIPLLEKYWYEYQCCSSDRHSASLAQLWTLRFNCKLYGDRFSRICCGSSTHDQVLKIFKTMECSEEILARIVKPLPLTFAASPIP